MSPSDLWLFHRERILRLGGILLAALSVAVVVGSTDAQGAYEGGRMAGTAARNIVIGLIAGAIGVYLYRRVRLLQDDARWTEITPESTLIAGVTALALALAGGAGDAGGTETTADVLGDSDACLASGTNPVEALPKKSYIELSPRQAARFAPAAAAAPAEIRSLVKTYVWGRGKEAAVVSVSAVGERALANPDFQAGFRDAQEVMGATAAEIDIAGIEVLEVRSPTTSETSTIAPIGCNQVSVLARSPALARERMEALLASG